MSTFTITGTLRDHGGRPLAGRVIRVTPDPLTSHGSGITYAGGATATTDAAGKVTLALVALEGTTYRLSAHGVHFKELPSPEAGAVVDLSDLVES